MYNNINVCFFIVHFCTFLRKKLKYTHNTNIRPNYLTDTVIGIIFKKNFLSDYYEKYF